MLQKSLTPVFSPTLVFLESCTLIMGRSLWTRQLGVCCRFVILPCNWSVVALDTLKVKDWSRGFITHYRRSSQQRSTGPPSPTLLGVTGCPGQSVSLYIYACFSLYMHIYMYACMLNRVQRIIQLHLADVIYVPFNAFHGSVYKFTRQLELAHTK